MSAFAPVAEEPFVSPFAPQASTTPGKQVCCLVDDSPASKEALKWAGSYMVRPQDTLHLVHITPYEAFVDKNAAKLALLHAEADAKSAGLEGHLETHLLTATVSTATCGVAEAVAAFVEREGIDVLVVGSRGLSNVKSSTLGIMGLASVSDACVHTLRCAVLVVKDPKTARTQRTRSASLDLARSVSKTLSSVFRKNKTSAGNSGATSPPLGSPGDSLVLPAPTTKSKDASIDVLSG